MNPNTYIHVFQKRCRELGGYLVKVDNVAENKWVSSHITKSINTSFTLDFVYVTMK